MLMSAKFIWRDLGHSSACRGRTLHPFNQLTYATIGVPSYQLAIRVVQAVVPSLYQYNFNYYLTFASCCQRFFKCWICLTAYYHIEKIYLITIELWCIYLTLLSCCRVCNRSFTVAIQLQTCYRC